MQAHAHFSCCKSGFLRWTGKRLVSLRSTHPTHYVLVKNIPTVIFRLNDLDLRVEISLFANQPIHPDESFFISVYDGNSVWIITKHFIGLLMSIMEGRFGM